MCLFRYRNLWKRGTTASKSLSKAFMYLSTRTVQSFYTPYMSIPVRVWVWDIHTSVECLQLLYKSFYFIFWNTGQAHRKERQDMSLVFGFTVKPGCSFSNSNTHAHTQMNACTDLPTVEFPFQKDLVKSGHPLWWYMSLSVHLCSRAIDHCSYIPHQIITPP